MDLWYTDLVLANLARFLWSESHLPHAFSTPGKYGPPRCSHLGGDSIRMTGFIVYIPQRLAALVFGLFLTFAIEKVDVREPTRILQSTNKKNQLSVFSSFSVNQLNI